ncbi:MAG: pilus assembly protein TadB [Clostridiales bacterium]|nr:pilus assembly protein TadB [Clostridiales bacterium]
MKKYLSMLPAAIIIFATAYLFYRSLPLAIAVIPLSALYPSMRQRRIAARERSELNLQFRDMLYSLSSSMSAGKTFEASLRDVHKDLAVLYPGYETKILSEVDIMQRKLGLNEPLETVIGDFAERMEMEDIKNFSEVFRISKRSGANLVEVIRNTTAIINDKLEILQEIDTMLAERRFEQKVLNVVPILMILLLSLTAPEYMAPVFSTLAGRLVMTASLGLLAISWLISAKITDIGV